ncbi:uncharacterized protein EAF01_003779 [Botrytis porri]|uniref:Uncharacterized protein n=1 Tax=Botrytis porri TaxID=87229 RepID=A0A4Z1KBW6_9HELO|nr:uncharacterized protein EAF01_003779 [Botrytis porri]KAF7908024.1 hypothetical protein EAF01_003779 [Botrytis porri]TGO83120.1 hypothetical protein BPOR_0699g00020 [Botrytis porri]
MYFSRVFMAAAAAFATLAVAGPSYPNLLDTRTPMCSNGQSCEGVNSDTCCYSAECCFVCSEGSDAECSPEITERSIFTEIA